MGLILELDDELSDKITSLAESLAVDPRQLAEAACRDLVSKPSDDFQRAVTYVLKKNQELYERLS